MILLSVDISNMLFPARSVEQKLVFLLSILSKNRDNLALLYELVTPTLDNHTPAPGLSPDREGIKQLHRPGTGSTLVVAGYGWCKRGIAMRSRTMGARVIVC